MGVIGQAHDGVQGRTQRELVGLRVDDVYGFYVGTVIALRAGVESGASWLLVRVGRFGERHTLIALTDVTGGGEYLWLPYERRTVHLAPTLGPDAELTIELEHALAAHWERARATEAPEVNVPRPRRAGEPAHRLGHQPGD